MKLKKDFILREIAGDYVLVPIGETVIKFNGLITLNEVGVFIWNNLDKVNSIDEIVNMLLEEYDVEEAVANKDVEEFLEILKKSEII